MLKKILLWSALITGCIQGFSQSAAINKTGNPPNPSALLDIDASGLSPKKGLLIPRVTFSERAAMNPLPAPAQGLMVYQTEYVQGFYYNTSTTTTPNWAYVSSSAAAWSINGNGGLTEGLNFIGTTDNVPLSFRVNNASAGRIEGGSIPVGLGGGMTVLGYGAGGTPSNTYCTAFGYQALNHLYNAQRNTAVGWNALYSNVNGYDNTAVGAGALYFGGEGGENTAVGCNALHGNNNNLNYGDFNTAVGYNALYNNISHENTALGSYALEQDTSGSWNTAEGFQSLRNNLSGVANTANGMNALFYNTTGSYNVAVGALAGSANSSNTGGNYNIFIGYNTGAVGNLQNAIAIGKNAVVTQSNTMMLGGTGADAVNVGIGIQPNSTLQIGGSLGTAVNNTSTNSTLTSANHTMIISGTGGATITLPAASSCVGRMYVILNHSSATCNTSIPYVDPTGAGITTLAIASSIWIQSDGTDWQQIK